MDHRINRRNKLKPHPIFVQAFRQYKKRDVLIRLGWDMNTRRLDERLNNPARYLSLEQIEALAGLSNLTFYEVLEIIRGSVALHSNKKSWFVV